MPTNKQHQLALVFIKANIPLLTVHGVREDGFCRCNRGALCTPAGKHPIEVNWQETGLLRTEQDLEDAWARESGLCNLGVATGHPLTDGRYLFVWDVDVDKGKPGAETVRALEKEGKWLPKTLTVHTGGGGLQFYLSSPSPVPCETGTLPGIDIRGVHGMVVAPGSTSGKGVYTLVTAVGIAESPEWVLDIIAAGKPVADRRQVDVDGSVILKGARDPKKVLTALEDDTGDRSEDTWRVVYTAATEGFTLEDARAAVARRSDLQDRLDSRSDDDVAAMWTKLRIDAKSKDVLDEELYVTWGDQIQHEIVTWGWSSHGGGRIPNGELILTPGFGGVGKSTFHAWLIAAITRGTLPGEYYGQPRRCLIAIAEESWSKAIGPRLKAADADMSMVGRIGTTSSENDAGRRLSLPNDIEGLRRLIDRDNIGLVSIDPLMSFINGAATDTYKSVDVRAVLEPLSKLAEKTGAVLLGNAHFNKSIGNSAMLKIGGSAAFGEVARAIISFTIDPDTGRGVLTQTKNNYGKTYRNGMPSLSYDITPTIVWVTADKSTEVTKFVLGGESSLHVDDILNKKPQQTGNRMKDSRKMVHLEATRLLTGGPVEQGALINRLMDATGASEQVVNRVLSDTKAFTRSLRDGVDGSISYRLVR